MLMPIHQNFPSWSEIIKTDSFGLSFFLKAYHIIKTINSKTHIDLESTFVDPQENMVLIVCGILKETSLLMSEC